MTAYRAFSSMCEIVNAYPPRSGSVATVAAQVRGSGCEISAVPARSAAARVGSLACEIASEFSVPGTQHIIERVCKTALGDSA